MKSLLTQETDILAKYNLTDADLDICVNNETYSVRDLFDFNTSSSESITIIDFVFNLNEKDLIKQDIEKYQSNRSALTLILDSLSSHYGIPICDFHLEHALTEQNII